MELTKNKQLLADYQNSSEGLDKILTILATLNSDMDLIQEKLWIFAQIGVFVGYLNF